MWRVVSFTTALGLEQGAALTALACGGISHDGNGSINAVGKSFCFVEG